jgi:hypothetical protein
MLKALVTDTLGYTPYTSYTGTTVVQSSIVLNGKLYNGYLNFSIRLPTTSTAVAQTMDAFLQQHLTPSSVYFTGQVIGVQDLSATYSAANPPCGA